MGGLWEGGGGQRVCWPPPLKLLGGGGAGPPAPPPPPSSYAYDIATPNSECRCSYYLSDTVLPEQAGLVNWKEGYDTNQAFNFILLVKLRQALETCQSVGWAKAMLIFYDS